MVKKEANPWTRIGLRIRQKDKDRLEEIAADKDVKIARYIRDLITEVTRKPKGTEVRK